MTPKKSIFNQTPRRTPLHTRTYLNSFNFHTPNANSNKIEEQQVSNEQIIYGTNINITKAMALLEKFVLEYEQVVPVGGQEVSERVYVKIMNDLSHEGVKPSNVVDVDGRHLYEYDRQLYYQFIYFPAEMISCFDHAIQNLYQKHFIEPETDAETRFRKTRQKQLIMVGIKHLHNTDKMCVKNLNPTKIGRLVLLQGIVIRSSEIYPEMKRAYFRCTECGQCIEIELENAKVQQPRQCPQCRVRDCLQIEHNLCEFTDKQYVKFQELPQLVSEGQTPSSLNILAYDSNVDSFRPGDKVQIIGIYRAIPVKVQRDRTTVKSVFNTYIDVISYNLLEENKLKISNNITIFNDQQKKIFQQMAEKQTIIQDLVSSFAPSIYGHDEIKKGILTQLFGGAKKNFSEHERSRFRSDINICLLGDPSTSKSQLLQQVHKISRRSIYTSGRGSSAVGLTANVRKDPQTREFVLESGALVLSDQGICCIDQFDKMDQNSRTILLQAMEQQTISIAKAGIVCQLNSRTAILAAANPINSKYDSSKSVIQNINLTPSLLSRFDLIYIILDIPNESFDKKLASHILDIYTNKPVESINKGTYSYPSLTKYISYARDYIFPQITQEAADKLGQEYLKLRQKGQTRNTISATPRQLQSLIRMSQAFAKMRLSLMVTVADVEQAVALMDIATMQTATDPQTGIINLDIITTGRSAAKKKRFQEIAEKIKTLILSNQSKFRKNTSIQRLQQDLQRSKVLLKQDFVRDQILQALKILESQDFIVLYGQSKYKPQFKLQQISQF